jgi:glycosyltransferase involved in cell wall biosynthesis
LLIARGEGKSLRETFQVEPAQEYLIPNGVPESFMVLPRRVSQRRGVLMVGRLEARKNQLSVLRAMRDTDVPVTIVGAANKYHRAYANLVHAELRRSSHSRYVPEVSHDQMRELYASHAVLVNPSWLEVAPLVDLEAAAMGCAVVATTAGYTHEYLGESALYVAPEASSDRIRDVIMQALLEAEPRSAAARARVELFTWARSAELLRQAYERVLGGASLSAPPLADEVALR